MDPRPSNNGARRPIDAAFGVGDSKGCQLAVALHTAVAVWVSSKNEWYTIFLVGLQDVMGIMMRTLGFEWDLGFWNPLKVRISVSNYGPWQT